jgi:hypothetical protein
MAFNIREFTKLPCLHRLPLEREVGPTLAITCPQKAVGEGLRGHIVSAVAGQVHGRVMRSYSGRTTRSLMFKPFIAIHLKKAMQY